MTKVSAAGPPFATKKTLWAWTVATFFGIGFWKPGPGTAGSIAATLIWWLAAPYIPTPGELAFLTAAAALFLLAIAIPAATVVARESGRKDPQIVVADEAVGQWITLIAAPAGWKFALIALVLFRTFDIWKPPPIRRIELLPGGWGIMLDDVAAGIYALLVMRLIHHWLR